MRIITKTQYDAICDIVTDLQKENEELKAKIAKKDKIIGYLNGKVFISNQRFIELLKSIEHPIFNIDFPAKKPEDKFY